MHPLPFLSVIVSMMCFVTYVLARDGAVWISCTYVRLWLHEDCTEECVVDQDHRERYCPICIDIIVLFVNM